MRTAKRIFYTVAPVLAFSYLAYEVLSGVIATGMTRRGQSGHDLMVWLSNTFGPTPTGVTLIALGLLLGWVGWRRG